MENGKSSLVVRISFLGNLLGSELFYVDSEFPGESNIPLSIWNYVNFILLVVVQYCRFLFCCLLNSYDVIPTQF